MRGPRSGAVTPRITTGCSRLQTAYAGLGYTAGDFGVSERLAERFLSLPMFPELGSKQIEEVVDGLSHALAPEKRVAI